MEKYFSIKTYFGYLSRSFQVRLYWMFACCQAKVYSKYLSNSLEMKAKYLLLFIFKVHFVDSANKSVFISTRWLQRRLSS